jgi:hypothetical protein
VHYHEVKQDVLLKIAAIIRAHGAEIAFPTRTLHIESDAGEAQPAPWQTAPCLPLRRSGLAAAPRACLARLANTGFEPHTDRRIDLLVSLLCPSRAPCRLSSLAFSPRTPARLPQPPTAIFCRPTPAHGFVAPQAYLEEHSAWQKKNL